MYVELNKKSGLEYTMYMHQYMNENLTIDR